LAKSYLPSLKIPGVTQALIEKYLNPLSLNSKPTSKEQLYCRILEHAQNANMKSEVIGGSIDGVDKLASVLYGFNPKAVLAEYGDNWQMVLDHIVKELNPRGQVRRTPQSIWPQYCRTILSAAEFIEQFASAEDFFRWIDFFDRDDRARASLPMLLGHEIEGFGFALSCNFLRNWGISNSQNPMFTCMISLRRLNSVRMETITTSCSRQSFELRFTPTSRPIMPIKCFG
jgi:hypothetical protein